MSDDQPRANSDPLLCLDIAEDENNSGDDSSCCSDSSDEDVSSDDDDDDDDFDLKDLCTNTSVAMNGPIHDNSVTAVEVHQTPLPSIGSATNDCVVAVEVHYH